MILNNDAASAEDDIYNNEWSPMFNSSNITKIKYDGKTSLMRVMFSSGSIYEYKGVPRSVFREFYYWKESKGKWFNENIKKKGYKFREVGKPMSG